MIKLVYGNKNKIIKNDKKNFEQLREAIQTNFPEAPVDYSLSYLDQDKDQICLNSDQDLVNMLSTPLKVYKVYIKQSISQTIVLDLEKTEVIEPSFEQPKKDEKKEEEMKEKFIKPAEPQKKVLEEPAQKVEEIPKAQKIEQIIVEKEEPKPVPEEPKPSQEQPQKPIEPEKPVAPQPQGQKLEQYEVKVQEWCWDAKQKKESQQMPAAPEEKDLQIQIQEVEEKVITLDIAIQSESIEIEVPKKTQSIKLDVDPGKAIISSSTDPKSVPIFEQNMHVTKARIFQKVPPIKQKKEEDLLQHKVLCSICKDDYGILGIRYQCLLCENFNLCSTHEEEADHPHSLVKVKKPGQEITKDDLLKKIKKDLHIPVQPVLPPGSFVPALSKEEAIKMMNEAKEAYNQGMQRAEKYMQDMFYKMEMSHKNPYNNVKPAPPVKVESLMEKAKCLQDLFNLSYNEAIRFVEQYPRESSENIVQLYFKMKNL